jgi:hypothetical protein
LPHAILDGDVLVDLREKVAVVRLFFFLRDHAGVISQRFRRVVGAGG